MKELIFQIVVGILSLWLVIGFVDGVEFNGNNQTIILIGGILGLLNFFLKPILNLVTLPLRILTLGLFGLIINMGIIWILDVFFEELDFYGIWPLFLTTLIIWTLSFLLSFLFPKRSGSLLKR